jgi:hypothetical protein
VDVVRVASGDVGKRIMRLHRDGLRILGWEYEDPSDPENSEVLLRVERRTEIREGA